VGNGKLQDSAVYPVNGSRNHWRLILDIERANGEPTDIRAFLSLDGEALTETFVYQLF
jgi:glucan biosynthesis protein